MRRPRAVLRWVVWPALVALAACSGSTQPSPGTATTATGRALVVASTPLVGALVRAVAGDQADVRVLIKPTADPRTGSVTEPDTALADADLVVFVDPAYETAMAPVVDAALGNGLAVLALAPALNPVPLGGSELVPGTVPAGAAGATDPHVWLDPDRWTQAARLVADDVSRLPGVDAAAVQAGLAAFDDAASRADEMIQAALGAVPDGRRVLVSDLPALAYLADRYGFELVLADDAPALAAAATTRGISVVLTAADRRDALAAALAAEAPAIVVVGLDLDQPSTAGGTVGTPGAAGYTGLIVTAADAIAAALRA